jgi:hypothetical protein
MGNIHGNCINVDSLARDGSSYAGSGEPDFLTANDAWFMPVGQETGPDGSLYILDWYDRYHCYQDANRDPKGIDRLKGRLYRIRYKDTPRAAGFDLTKATDDELIERLGAGNDFIRHTAQRVLVERNKKETRVKLVRLMDNPQSPAIARMHALWALLSAGPPELEWYLDLFEAESSAYRSWAVRAAGNDPQSPEIADKVAALARDPSPDVRLQVAIAARKVKGLDPLPVLVTVLANSGDDKLIPHIVWQNLHPLLETRSAEFLAEVKKYDLKTTPSLAKIMPRVTERILAAKKQQ